MAWFEAWKLYQDYHKIILDKININNKKKNNTNTHCDIDKNKNISLFYCNQMHPNYKENEKKHSKFNFQYISLNMLTD